MMPPALVLALLQVGPPPPPPPPSPSPLAEARKYAPIVWIANSEPAYPMLPYAFAFDGIDNDCDGKYDLADPSEVQTEDDAPGIPEYASMLLDAEEQRLRHYQNDKFPKGVLDHPHKDVPPDCAQPRAYGMPAPGAAVDKHSGEVEPYFGPQARVIFVGPPDREAVLGWNSDRAAIPARWNSAIGRRTTLLQYWLYYPFDMGPNPHRHDGEHISVFVERDEDDHPRVKAVVGAGHEANSVNNALIAGPLDTHPPANLILPRNLPDHMPILVELGKHASAPDVDCNGRFDLGADANVYSESVWGSRDVWAGTAGKTLKVGRFEAWFSFPRARTQRYLIDQWWKDPTEARKYRLACPDLIYPGELPEVGAEAADASFPRPSDPTVEMRSDKGSPVQTAQTDTKIAALTEAQLEPIVRSLTRSYELFDLKDLYALHELLASPRCRDDQRCSLELQRFFEARKESFWGSRAPGEVVVDPESARRMKTWATEEPDHVARRDVWKHEAFQKPASDFRVWLFKRLGIGYGLKLEGGNFVSGGMVRIADLLSKDSRVEVYAHFDGLSGDTERRLYDAGVDFYSSRTRFFGAYFGFGYNADFKTSVSASAGLNLYIANLAQFKLPRDLSFSVFAGINGELFRERMGEKVVTLENRPKAESLRFQVGVRSIWGFWGPRHPLAR
jgi:hypothetical protein